MLLLGAFISLSQAELDCEICRHVNVLVCKKSLQMCRLYRGDDDFTHLALVGSRGIVIKRNGCKAAATLSTT